MEIVPIKIQHVEEKAWAQVCGLSRDEVCRRTDATFDEKAEAYCIRSFGIDFHVNPCEMLIACPSDRGGLFLGKLKDFFRIAMLWYMSNAKEIPTTGRLIRPIDVKGGHRFSAGTHMLPLDRIAEKYGKDKDGF